MARGMGRHRVLTTALVVLVVLGVSSAIDDDRAATTRGDRTTSLRQDAAGASPREQSAEARTESRQRPARPAERRDEPQPRSYLVTRVVDGDTLELGNGQTVRLVGIDTPELGECGYERAKDHLEDLSLHRRVRLTVSDEDRDQYGRLLRYVDVGAKDAGLRLIQHGNAVARYDSRDGYGYHPREGLYVRADRAAKDFRCSRPAPAPAPRPLVGGGCAAGYRPCIPPYPPDLDCADVNGPIYVTGSDPHALDADGDGVACEWG